MHLHQSNLDRKPTVLSRVQSSPLELSIHDESDILRCGMWQKDVFVPNTITTVILKDILPLMNSLVQRATLRSSCDGESWMMMIPSPEGCTRSNYRKKNHHRTVHQQLIPSHQILLESAPSTIDRIVSSSSSQPSLDRYQHSTINHRETQQILPLHIIHHHHHVADHVRYLVWKYVEKGVSFRDEAAVRVPLDADDVFL